MSDPSAPLSVTDVDAADLVSPEGAAAPADDVDEAGDAVGQAMGGAPAADEAPGTDEARGTDEAPTANEGSGPDEAPGQDEAPTANEAPGADEAPDAPAPSGSGRVDVDDLAPALATAGIGVDGQEPAAEDVVTVPTGEAARQGKAVDMALGVVRLGVGAALVAAPGWAGRIWVGPGADGPGSLVFARAIGARDVALGLRILDGARKGEPVRHWVQAGFAADLADVATTLIAGRHLTPGRRIAMPLIAGAVGAAGILSTRRA